MTDDSDSWERLQRTLQDTLADTLHAHDGSMVTRFVVLLDAIGADGERYMVQMAAPDMKPWDSLGMLRHAENQELAATIRDDDGD